MQFSISIKHTRHGGWNRHEVAIQSDIQEKLKKALNDRNIFDPNRYAALELFLEFSDREAPPIIGPTSNRRHKVCAKKELAWQTKVDSDRNEMELFIGQSACELLLLVAEELCVDKAQLVAALCAVLPNISLSLLPDTESLKKTVITTPDESEMNEQLFWQIIEHTRASNISDHARNLSLRLNQLTPGEVLDFELIQRRQAHKAYSWELWAIPYIAYDGCSDDAFANFRTWMVFLGQQSFQRCLKDRLFLAKQLSAILPSMDPISTDDFEFTATTVYEKKTGWSTLDVSTKEEMSMLGDPSGEQWDESEVCELFPKICKQLKHRH